jgi:Ca2+-binding RTX toxin-like protein
VYFTDSTTVSINLQTGTHTGTDAAGDVYQNIELFSLSQYGDSFVGNSDVVNIYGLGGDDTIIGGNVATLIVGGVGADSIIGGSQNDTIFGDDGADTVDGGAGLNQIDYSASTAGVTVNLLTNSNSGGYAAGDVLSNIERILGSGYGDFLTGDNGANGIYAGGGADTLVGGVGADNLFGDAGADRFVYQSLSDSSTTVSDTIGDFSQGDGDKIDLTAFGTGITFNSGSYTGTAKEVAFFNPPGSYTYVGYDEDGDQNTDFVIAFDDVITFSSSDFIIA